MVPILTEFNPDFTIISSGFDAARHDPLGGCELDRDGYAYMTRRVMQETNKKILVILEGGYNLK